MYFHTRLYSELSSKQPCLMEVIICKIYFFYLITEALNVIKLLFFYFGKATFFSSWKQKLMIKNIFLGTSTLNSSPVEHLKHIKLWRKFMQSYLLFWCLCRCSVCFNPWFINGQSCTVMWCGCMVLTLLCAAGLGLFIQTWVQSRVLTSLGLYCHWNCSKRWNKTLYYYTGVTNVLQPAG